MALIKKIIITIILIVIVLAIGTILFLNTIRFDWRHHTTMIKPQITRMNFKPKSYASTRNTKPSCTNFGYTPSNKSVGGRIAQ